jgi:hypothetical protein
MQRVANRYKQKDPPLMQGRITKRPEDLEELRNDSAL